jgi:teichuronic acid biosynthesis glycosyltransferase TuaH
MTKKRILYLMHVDWRWIKQRPHILAEGLQQSFEVLVAHRAYLDSFRYPQNKSAIRRAKLIPWLDRGGAFWHHSDAFLNRARVGLLIQQFQPDLIWVCFPSLLAYIPPQAKHIPVVYDCMDLDIGFYDNPNDQTYIQKIGDETLNRAALVVCSSMYLEQNVQQRYRLAKTLLVRNGIQQAWLKNQQNFTPAKKPFRLGYFGTIAPWFDWEMMLRVLEQLPELHLEMIGPNHTRTITHPRVKYTGVIAHAELPHTIQNMDGFVMPFVKSDLIQGVDPVKLYEYLSTGKEVFAVSYPEIDRFDSFVHLYTSEQHLITLLRQWQSGTLEVKNDPTRTTLFLEDNTWEQRIQVLSQRLWHVLGQDTLR